MKERYKIFVGSATESLDVAYAIQENMEHVAELTVWTQGIFHLSRTSLESLVASLEKMDFAIFVFTPDDLLRLREREFEVTRDNVVYELGLFTGKLGSSRTFLVIPRGHENFHLPSDIAGLTPATFDSNRSDGNLIAALGPACAKIKRQVESVGSRTLSIKKKNEGEAVEKVHIPGDFLTGSWVANWNILDPKDVNDPQTSDIWNIRSIDIRHFEGEGEDDVYGSVICLGRWSLLSVVFHYWYSGEDLRQGVVYLTPDPVNRPEPNSIELMKGNWIQLGRGGRIHGGEVVFVKRK